MKFSIACLFFISVTLLSAQARSDQDAGLHDGHEHSAPMVFVQNKGQWEEPVKYRADVIGATVFLEEGGFTWAKLEERASEVMHDAAQLTEEERQKIQFNGHAWKMNFVEPSASMKITTSEASPFYHNYFLGNVPSKWASRVPLFQELSYTAVWPGIDMVLHSHEGHLKYDLMVSPHSDVSRIAFSYEGLDGISVSEKGELILRTSVGDVIEMKPKVFYADGRNELIECRYDLDGNVLRFMFPNGFDATRRMVIDPVLIAATYSGATGASNYGHCAAYDEFGNIYTGARNFGPSYPTSVGAFQSAFGGGGTDISLSKYNPDGSELIWASYLGGNSGENPHSLIANLSGELIVLGSTNSPNFPTTPGAYSSTLSGQDITITRISSDGTTLLGSTFIGGSGTDGTNSVYANYGEAYRGEVYLDAAENIMAVSFTGSNDFPVTEGAYQTTLSGAQDAVIFRLDPACTTLMASTYFGGSNDDAGMGLRTTDSGDVIIAGYTLSSDLPTTPGSYQTSLQGIQDAFISRFSSDLTTLINGTYFGTSGSDRSYFVDLDNDGSVWIYGQTDGQMPIQPAGVFSEAGGRIFVAKFDPDLTDAPVTTAFGSGFVGTVPVAFLLDVCDQIYICGYNSDSSLPLTSDALYTYGSFYIAVFNTDMSGLAFGTYYGGSHVDGGTSRFDKNGLVYQGVCSGGQSMQSAPWAYAPTNQISWDIAVFKIDMQQSGVQVYIQTDDELEGCAPATYTFNGSGNSPVYTWDLGDGSPIVTGPTITHTYTEAGTYVVMLIGSDPETCNLSDTTMLTIYLGDALAPLASFDAEPQSSCSGYGAQFQNNSSPATDLLWDFGDGESSTLDDPFHSYDAPGTYDVWLTIVDEVCGGSDSAMVSVVIPPATMEYEVESPLYICDGAAALLDAGGGYDSYEWSTGSTDQMISVTEPGDYSVTVSEGFCTGMDQFQVLPAPEVPKLDDTYGCPGLETLLTVPFATNNVSWNTGADSATISVTQNGMYWYSAIDPYGCTVHDTVMVNLIPVEEAMATVPNVFSPNNDGKNDRFEVQGLALQDFQMEIFNRWGQLMFTSTNQSNGWNGGRDNSADKTPEGTYYYVISFKDICSDQPRTTHQGHVTLLR